MGGSLATVVTLCKDGKAGAVVDEGHWWSQQQLFLGPGGQVGSRDLKHDVMLVTTIYLEDK